MTYNDGWGTFRLSAILPALLACLFTTLAQAQVFEPLLQQVVAETGLKLSDVAQAVVHKDKRQMARVIESVHRLDRASLERAARRQIASLPPKIRQKLGAEIESQLKRDKLAAGLEQALVLFRAHLDEHVLAPGLRNITLVCRKERSARCDRQSAELRAAGQALLLIEAIGRRTISAAERRKAVASLEKILRARGW